MFNLSLSRYFSERILKILTRATARQILRLSGGASRFWWCPVGAGSQTRPFFSLCTVPYGTAQVELIYRYISQLCQCRTDSQYDQWFLHGYFFESYGGTRDRDKLMVQPPGGRSWHPPHFTPKVSYFIGI